MTEPRPGLLSRFIAPKGTSAQDIERERQVRQLDVTERKVGWAVAAVVLVSALAFIPYLTGVRHFTETAKKTKKGCPSGYELVKDTCTRYVTTHPSDFVLGAVMTLVLGLLLLFAVWRSRRTLTIFAAAFAGLAGFATNPQQLLKFAMYGGGLFYAFWLFIRARNVRRYGAPDSRSAREARMAESAERRAQRAGGSTRATRGSASTSKTTAKSGSTSASKKGPQPSKRYTPKKTTRKKPPATKAAKGEQS